MYVLPRSRVLPATFLLIFPIFLIISPWCGCEGGREREREKWKGCVTHARTHARKDIIHTHTHTNTHTQILYYICILSLSLSLSLSLPPSLTLSLSLSLSHTQHSSWPAEVVQCLEDILDIQAQLVYDNLPPEAQAKWLALSYVALPGSEGRGGGRGEGGGGGGR